MASAVTHFSEVEDLPNNHKQLTVLAYPKYFLDDSEQYQEVNCTFVASDDPAYDWMIKTGVYRLYVKDDATFKFEHFGDEVVAKLDGIGFYNTDTQERVVRQDVTLSGGVLNPEGDTITWIHGSGATYSIYYGNDTLKDVLTFPQNVRTYLKNNQPAGWNLSNTWIGVIYDYDISASDLPDVAEDDGDINCVIDGRVKHRIKAAMVKHANWNDDIPAHLQGAGLRWLKRKILRNGKYVEAIPVSALDSVDGSLIFNTEITVQEGTDGYSGCIDNYIQGSAATTNNGGDADIKVNENGSFHFHTLIAFDLSDELAGGETINSCQLEVNFYYVDNGGSDPAAAWRIFKPWEEMDSTWNRWDHSGTNEWTTAGCDSGDDGGTWNSGDGTGADRRATADDTYVSSSTGWWDWGGVTDDAMADSLQAQLDDSNWRGWMLGFTSGTPDTAARSSEYATVADRPKLTVDYTAAGGSPSPKAGILGPLYGPLAGPIG